MTARGVGYWICTAVTALVFLSGGVFDVLRPPEVLAGMVHLGYPAYFVVILGVWKVLGGGAVLVPRFPLLKEWAYAGMIFDLTGATASHIAAGDDLRHILTPLVLAAVTVASWALRPASRRLPGV
jgi:hypothetical protein